MFKNLSPIPWRFGVCGNHTGLVCIDYGNVRPVLQNDDDLKWAAIAREAYEIRLKRNWFALPYQDGWRAAHDLGGSDGMWNWVINAPVCDNPESALVEADILFP